MKKCTICKGEKINHTLCRKIWRKNYRIENYASQRIKERVRWKRYYDLHKKENTERLRKYRQTKAGKEAIRRAIQKYELKNPLRRKAWNAVKNIYLKPCEICDSWGTHRHHPNINKPKEIVFLCPQHHRDAHNVKSENV